MNFSGGIKNFFPAPLFLAFFLLTPILAEAANGGQILQIEVIGPSPTVTPTPTPTPSPTPTPTPTPTPPLPGGTGFLPPKPRPFPLPPVLAKVDFNQDRRVDIVDLSILLFYWDKSGAVIEPFDFNADGRVDLVDVSILMYYWTG